MRDVGRQLCFIVGMVTRRINHARCVPLVVGGLVGSGLFYDIVKNMIFFPHALHFTWL